MRSRRRTSEAESPGNRDEGSALILALVLILVGSLMVLPVMKYTMTVTRVNRLSVEKANRVEATKAGLRVALYDPVALYQACSPPLSGPGVAVAIVTPPGLSIQSKCNSMAVKQQDVPSEQRYALATVQAGSNAAQPAPFVVAGNPADPLNNTVGPAWCTSMTLTGSNTVQTPCGRVYPGNGNADTSAWMAARSSTMAKDTLFNPMLPPFSNSTPSATGYMSGNCRLYFPGRYVDDVVISDNVPVYFVSGIYYFEKALRISGNANVVVGAGATPGCVDSDSIAVFSANAPDFANSSGVGGTFVFGANGRLVIDTATSSATTGMSLKFNRRLVDKTDPLAPLNDVAIMSVNGVWDGTTTSDLDIPGQLHVPVTKVLNGATVIPDPWTHKYKASNLVSTAAAPVPCAVTSAAPAASCPVIDINFTTAAAVDVKIAGYVDVPQGAISVNVTAGSGANKKVAFAGGILAAQVAVTSVTPDFFQMGLLNPVVQQTFKITTETTAASGVPHIVSTALVQVNETGGYAINSWVTQPG